MNNLSRRLMLAQAATVLGVAALPVAAAPENPQDDSRLSRLISRYREIEKIIDVITDEEEALNDGLPSREWTREELIAHRIDGEKVPHFVSLNEIEKNDGWDWPGHNEISDNTADDGTTKVMSITIRRRTPTEEELEAWRGRCAARRALYDAKEAVFDDARQTSGLHAVEKRGDMAHDERGRLMGAIKTYRPRTMAGALEKLRFYREYDRESFGGDPNELNWAPTLFLSALADLERLTQPGREGRV